MTMRRYRSDDRDLAGHDLDLFVRPPDGNGDWYIGICDHEARGGQAVRITTSGTPDGQHGACVALAHLYRALGGEDFAGFNQAPVHAEQATTGPNTLAVTLPIVDKGATFMREGITRFSDGSIGCSYGGHLFLVAPDDVGAAMLAALKARDP